jgi:hypothetical protein
VPGVHVGYGDKPHVGVDADQEADGQEEPSMPPEHAPVQTAAHDQRDLRRPDDHHVHAAGGRRQQRQEQPGEDVVEAVDEQQPGDEHARVGHSVRG